MCTWFGTVFPKLWRSWNSFSVKSIYCVWSQAKSRSCGHGSARLIPVVAYTVNLYPGGTEFGSQPGCVASCLRFFVVFLRLFQQNIRKIPSDMLKLRPPILCVTFVVVFLFHMMPYNLVRQNSIVKNLKTVKLKKWDYVKRCHLRTVHKAYRCKVTSVVADGRSRSV